MTPNILCGAGEPIIEAALVPLTTSRLNYYSMMNNFNNYSEVMVAMPVLGPFPKSDLLAILKVTSLQNLPYIQLLIFTLSLVLPRKDQSISLWRMWQPDIRKTFVIVTDALIEIIKSLLGLCCLALVVPILLPIVLIFFSISEGVRSIYKYRYGSSASKAAGQDAIWGNETPESRPFITVGITMEGTPSVQKIRSAFQQRILGIKDKNGVRKYRKFCQLITTELGYYIWKDVPNFDLDYHIRMWRDPVDQFESGARSDASEDGTRTATEEVICRYLDQYGSDPLPINRPQWEVIVIISDNVPKGKYPLIMRLHHSIGDGVSLVRLILGNLVDKPIILPSVGAPAIHPALKLLTSIWAMSLLPMEVYKIFSSRDRNPFHGPTLTGRKLFLISNGIKMKTLKEIKTASGTTINDVLMSCLSAALSRTFSKRWQFYTPHVTVMIPVSYHDLTKEVSLVNSFLTAILQLPTPLSSDVLHHKERLLMVKHACDDMKRDVGMMALYSVVQLACVIFPAKMVELMFSLRGLTMGASNVPGPQHEVQFWGDTLGGLVFWVPDRAPTGAGVGMVSYRGMVRVGLMLDSALVADKTDMETVFMEFEQEVRGLHASLIDIKKVE